MHTYIQSFIQSLDWDTEQLGLSTAKILTADYLLLSEILAQAKSKKYRLLYWLIDQPEDIDEKENLIKIIKERYQGLLVDYKTTYHIDLHQSLNQDLFKPGLFKQAQIYHKTEDLSEFAELINLAYESGKYSRFSVDPFISKAQFKNIYKQWMINSVNQQIAKEIFIIKDSQALLGMATVGEKNQRGDIGLLAVSEKARGKQIGIGLIYSALQYFREQGYQYSQVVTQKTNIAACKLYEKCGYTLEKTELFFHFHL